MGSVAQNLRGTSVVGDVADSWVGDVRDSTSVYEPLLNPTFQQSLSASKTIGAAAVKRAGSVRRASVNAGVGSTSPATTYLTSFPTIENPLSEGGAWTTLAADSTVCKVVNISGTHVVCGTMSPGGTYDDSTAKLSGFGPSHRISGVIRRAAGVGMYAEIELRLQQTDTGISYTPPGSPYGPTQVRAYEINMDALGTYANIGQFKFASAFVSVVPPATADGDIFSAEVIKSGGNNIVTVRLKGVTLMTYTDSSPPPDGQPGIGFWINIGGDVTWHCFKSVNAQDLTNYAFYDNAQGSNGPLYLEGTYSIVAGAAEGFSRTSNAFVPTSTAVTGLRVMYQGLVTPPSKVLVETVAGAPTGDVDWGPMCCMTTGSIGGYLFDIYPPGNTGILYDANGFAQIGSTASFTYVPGMKIGIRYDPVTGLLEGIVDDVVVTSGTSFAYGSGRAGMFMSLNASGDTVPISMFDIIDATPPTPTGGGGGVVVKQVRKIGAAAKTAVATVVRRTGKILSAARTAAASVSTSVTGGGTANFKTLTASLTVAVSGVRRTGAVRAATKTCGAAIRKSVAVARSASRSAGALKSVVVSTAKAASKACSVSKRIVVGKVGSASKACGASVRRAVAAPRSAVSTCAVSVRKALAVARSASKAVTPAKRVVISTMKAASKAASAAKSLVAGSVHASSKACSAALQKAVSLRRAAASSVAVAKTVFVRLTRAATAACVAVMNTASAGHYAITLTASTLVVGTARKAVAIRRAAAQTSAAAVRKLARMTRAATATCTATLVAIRVFLKTLTASVTASASSRRAVSAIRAVAKTCTGTVRKAMARTTTVSSTVVTVCRKLVARTRSATMACVAFASGLKVKIMTLSASVAASASVRRSTSMARRASAACVSSARRTTMATRRAATAVVSTVRKFISAFRSVVKTVVATMAERHGLIVRPHDGSARGNIFTALLRGDIFRSSARGDVTTTPERADIIGTQSRGEIVDKGL